jgi:hypothetical protein
MEIPRGSSKGSYACPLASEWAGGILPYEYFLKTFNSVGIAFFAFHAQGKGDGIGRARVFNACGAAAKTLTIEEYESNGGENTRCLAQPQTSIVQCRRFFVEYAKQLR